MVLLSIVGLVECFVFPLRQQTAKLRIIPTKWLQLNILDYYLIWHFPFWLSLWWWAEFHFVVVGNIFQFWSSLPRSKQSNPGLSVGMNKKQCKSFCRDHWPFTITITDWLFLIWWSLTVCWAVSGCQVWVYAAQSQLTTLTSQLQLVRDESGPWQSSPHTTPPSRSYPQRLSPASHRPIGNCLITWKVSQLFRCQFPLIEHVIVSHNSQNLTFCCTLWEESRSDVVVSWDSRNILTHWLLLVSQTVQ